MRQSRAAFKTALLALIISVLVFSAFAQTTQLGRIDFPTSGSREAQEHFLRGVAALHSFWYEEALEAFQAATKIDPDFALGYWGEAMTYNHPIWLQQDSETGRKALARIKNTSKLSALEKALIDALRVLYGDGDKLARDLAYAPAMEKIYRDYPDDLEVAAFYSLALLGTVRPGDKGFQRQVKAGAIALEVYQRNPNHPGAAHYVIHSFDDPEHAILALPAARRYAEIAPEAHHARHMPAHIFLQLGMWPEAAASNESAWAVSNEWVKRKGLPLSALDYHSLHWLEYVYMQQGRHAKAEELLSIKRSDVERSKSDAGVVRYNEDMAALFVVESEKWNLVSKLFAAGGESAGDAGHAMHNAPAAPVTGRGRRSQSLPAFIRGFAAAKTGSPDADRFIAQLQAVRKQLADAGDYAAKSAEIMELEVTAVAAAAKSNYAQATELLKRATGI